MAADEVMLQAAVTGVASIRFYAWETPTLSLGYFQYHRDRLQDPRLAVLPWVRRATGGGAIVHEGDLTYAIAFPDEMRRGLSPGDWHCRIHHLLAELLRRHRIEAEVLSGQRLPPARLDFLCFAVPQPGDVLLGGRKIIGGAQRLRAGALLQHGSIRLSGIVDQAATLARHFAAALSWEVVEENWQGADLERIDELARAKYRQEAWNLKR
jgi:lipoate-protein ligase A